MDKMCKAVCQFDFSQAVMAALKGTSLRVLSVGQDLRVEFYGCFSGSSLRILGNCLQILIGSSFGAHCASQSEALLAPLATAKLLSMWILLHWCWHWRSLSSESNVPGKGSVKPPKQSNMENPWEMYGFVFPRNGLFPSLCWVESISPQTYWNVCLFETGNIMKHQHCVFLANKQKELKVWVSS